MQNCRYFKKLADLLGEMAGGTKNRASLIQMIFYRKHGIQEKRRRMQHPISKKREEKEILNEQVCIT